MPKAKSTQPSAEGEGVKKPANLDRILTLTTAARIVSWVLFGVGGIMLLMALVQAAENIGRWFDLLETLLIFVLSLLPIFMGLVLQFLIEGVHLAAGIGRTDDTTKG
ncbi:MAG TPA: hypothetical protein PLF42_10760 [Anaerolineales bacterium]|nr:hypothetical protein [Anaerolineales bacterium]